MFKKIQFKLEYLLFFLRRNYFFLILGLVIGTGAFVLKDKIFAVFTSPRFQTKTIGIEGLFGTNNLPREITEQISYGLVKNTDNDKQELSPLVKSIDIQNNNKDYLITLNDNQYWHTGKKFTAYDVNYDIEGIDIKPLSNTTLKISLDKEFSPLLSLLSQPLFKKNLVGLNNYQVKKIDYQDSFIKRIQLVSVSQGYPNIIYKFYQNEKDIINAYKLGEVDEIEVNTLPKELSEWPKTKITQSIQTNKKYSAIFFNTEKLNNKQLRQALAYATPKTRDRSERALGPISASSWAYNPSVKEYNFNATRAKELFEKNAIDSIKLTVNDRKLLPLAESIKTSWKNVLNIEVNISVESKVDTQNFEALLAYGGIPHDPDQYLFWHSTQQKTNLTKINNSRIDKLLEEGRQISDPVERKKIYLDFQKFLLEESPAVFLTYPQTFNILRLR